MIKNITAAKIKTLRGHQNPIYALANGKDETQLFSAGNDKGVVEWNLKEMRFEKVVYPVKSSVYALFFLEHSELLVIAERSGLVSVVNSHSKQKIAELVHHIKPVFGLQAFKHKPELVVTSEDGTVSIWNTSSFQLLYNFKVAKESIRCLAISPDEQHLAFGGKDGVIYLYDAAEYSLLQKIEAHTFSITSLTYSPDGKYLLSAGRDALLKVFQVSANYKDYKQVTAHLFSIYGIKYHASGLFFATASRDKTIKLWRAEDFSLARVINIERGFDAHKLSINCLMWSKHQDLLVSAGDDKSIMLWEVTADQ